MAYFSLGEPKDNDDDLSITVTWDEFDDGNADDDNVAYKIEISIESYIKRFNSLPLIGHEIRTDFKPARIERIVLGNDNVCFKIKFVTAL